MFFFVRWFLMHWLVLHVVAMAAALVAAILVAILQDHLFKLFCLIPFALVFLIIYCWLQVLQLFQEMEPEAAPPKPCKVLLPMFPAKILNQLMLYWENLRKQFPAKFQKVVSRQKEKSVGSETFRTISHALFKLIKSDLTKLTYSYECISCDLYF
jgi:hypothetical protein